LRCSRRVHAVYADGALGLKRMANMLAGASLHEAPGRQNLVSVGDLVHDFNALRNVLQITWNWESAQNDFTRVNLLIDAASVTIHKQADPLKLKFRGLHGSIHSSTILAQRFDALRDRYTGPPLARRHGAAEPEQPGGRRRRPGEAAGRAGLRREHGLDRSFEIQNIAIDWVTGAVGLKLFASSQAPGAIPATADAVVLPDAWYSSQGTSLASVVTITGSNPGHVTAGGTLTGTSDLNAAGSIFYYPGDLVVDPASRSTSSTTCNCGSAASLQNNGTFNGVGNGPAGAAATGSPGSAFDFNPGTVAASASPRRAADCTPRLGIPRGEQHEVPRRLRGGRCAGRLFRFAGRRRHDGDGHHGIVVRRPAGQRRRSLAFRKRTSPAPETCTRPSSAPATARASRCRRFPALAAATGCSSCRGIRSPHRTPPRRHCRRRRRSGS
jgi:hypothetical protein